ncbi:MAG: hypothetical protein HDR21_13940 [Lachnospiraceae bacterium]|nr:hypothetical protein [Lachnospiraceae bacterium]
MGERYSIIEVTIKARIETYDTELVKAIDKNDENIAYPLAHSLVKDFVECCGLCSRDMTIDDIEYRNEGGENG